MHETSDTDFSGLSAGPRLGIVGGGQLARMTALAALELGCDVVVLEKNAFSPAATLATHSIVGNWDTPAALLSLAAGVDVVTLENEFVDARALRAVEASGRLVLPGADCVARTQDKLTQKNALVAAGLPVARYRAVATPDELRSAGAALGWPVVLKKRRNGYDDKGNATLAGEADVERGWRALDGDREALYVEGFCPFAKELAVIVTRGRDGNTAVYPVVETVQRDHICHLVRAPAPVPAEVARAASDIARRAVEAVDGRGSFGVEMFLVGERELVINELAPRVHNSGHYTIEACACSQFENHVRAVLGWPLGSTAMLAPAAVMINLLGSGKGPGRPQGVERALGVPGAHLHLYGKTTSNAGRKMGHVTALGNTIAEAEATARRAADEIGFGSSG